MSTQLRGKVRLSRANLYSSRRIIQGWLGMFLDEIIFCGSSTHVRLNEGKKKMSNGPFNRKLHSLIHNCMHQFLYPEGRLGRYEGPSHP